MSLFDLQLMSKQIDETGESVTVRAVSTSATSKWGDETESTSDTASVRCMVNVLTQEDELVTEGQFKSGDKRFFFKGNASNISRGNRIQHDSKWYEIAEIIPHFIRGTTYLKVALAKKV